MPRSSKIDAVEKFRFSVFVIPTGFSFDQIVSNFTTFLRGGFSEVVMPKQTTTSMEYRENIDSTHVQTGPGLTRCDPMTLKRGVTSSSDFYRWASDVHNGSDIIASAIQRGRGDPSDKPPGETYDFRRDILIVVYGRGGAAKVGAAGNVPGVDKIVNLAGAAGLSLLGVGDVVKAVLVREAWVTGFRPGDTLSSVDDQTKLMEELEIRYESFEEITLESLLAKRAGAAGAVVGGIGATVLKGGKLF